MQRTELSKHTVFTPSCSSKCTLHLSTHDRKKIEWDCNYMNWEIAIWFSNLLKGHDPIILGVGVLNCYCFGVLHSHYVWFHCRLSFNCAFEANQIGGFHLLRRQDGPCLIGVPLRDGQAVLMKLQNCMFNAVFLRAIWLCIWMKHTANRNSMAKLWVQTLLLSLPSPICTDDQLQVLQIVALPSSEHQLWGRQNVFSE